MASLVDRRWAIAKRRLEQLARDEPMQRTIRDRVSRRPGPVVGRAVSSSEELLRIAFEEVEQRPSVAARVDVVGERTSICIMSTREDAGADGGAVEVEEDEDEEDEGVAVDGEVN